MPHRARGAVHGLLTLLSVSLAVAVTAASTATADTVVRDCTERGLRAAVARGGAITFACPVARATILLSQPIEVTLPTRIDGGLLGRVVIGSAGYNTVGFRVPPGGSIDVRRLMFTVAGSSIRSAGRTVVIDCTFSNGTLSDGGGSGALISSFWASVQNSRFSGNTVGAWLTGTSTVQGCRFERNGIGIRAGAGHTSASHTVFLEHTGLGAIQTTPRATVAVSLCTFIRNGGSGTSGAIYNEGGALSVDRCTFTENRGNQGAGILSFSTSVKVLDSTFTGNAASQGGAIYNHFASVLTVERCTFNANRGSSGGAIFTFADASVTNSTFAGNSASTSGGAITANLTATRKLTVTSSTFSGNAAPTSSTLHVIGPAEVRQSIVRGDGATPACTNPVAGGENLQWPPDGRPCGPSFRLDDPILGPLASNGWHTQTMALLAGSAAIDAVSGTCVGGDQRTVPRPQDGDGDGIKLCDIGSFESQGF